MERRTFGWSADTAAYEASLAITWASLNSSGCICIPRNLPQDDYFSGDHSNLIFVTEQTWSKTTMTEQQNIAAWLPGVGKSVEVGPAHIPEPGQDELLIEVCKIDLFTLVIRRLHLEFHH